MIPKAGLSTMSVAFVTDEAFLVPTLVAMHSLITTRRQGSAGLRIYVMSTEDVSRKVDLRWVQELDPACTADVLAVEEQVEELDRAKGRARAGHVPSIALAKLILPEIIEDGGNRILYVDSDMLVRRDLSHLADLDLAGRPAAAAVDISALVKGRYWTRANPHYLNSGLLLVDREQWRLHDMTPRIYRAAARDRMHRFMDQDILNDALLGRAMILEPEYNVIVDALYGGYSADPMGELVRVLGVRPQDRREFVGGARVLHYSGAQSKPWHSTRAPWSEYWWREFDELGVDSVRGEAENGRRH